MLDGATLEGRAENTQFSKGQNAYLAATVFVGAAIRFFQLGRESLWFDESLSALFASQPLPVSIDSMLQEGLQHSPLFYLLLRPFASSEPISASLRTLAAIFGILAIPTIALLGKALFSSRTGLIAASILAISPFHAWYSREARMYSLLVWVAIGAMYFFARNVIHRPKLRYWLGMSFFCAVGFNTHHFAFFIPLVQLVFIVATFRQSHRIVRAWAGSLLLAGLALIPWITIVLRSGVYWATSGTETYGQLTDIPLTLWNFSFGYTIKPTAPILLALLLFLAVAFNGIFPINRSKLLLAIWLVIPLATTFLISLRFPMYMDRYLIVALPAFLLAVSEGLSSIRLPSLRRIAMVTILLVELLSLTRIFVDRSVYDRADWRSLGSFLESNADPIHDSIATLNFQDLIPLHFYYRGVIPVWPIIVGPEVHLPNLVSSSPSGAESSFWLIIPHPNQSNHLVGHCQSFESGMFTPKSIVISWRDQLASELVNVYHLTCIRLERYVRWTGYETSR